MKKITYLIGLAYIFNVSSIFAQNEGVITYEITINNHRTLPADQQDMKAMVPQYRTFKQQLFFNDTESLYKLLMEDDDEDEQQGGGRRFRNRMANTTHYFNQSTNIFLSQMEMMGKKYIISDTLKTSPWKFGTETKVIQGYTCMQAYYTSTGERKQIITAWFTNKLRPMLGPEKYNSLPGTILAIDINNGERVIVAKKIELRPLKKNELSAPTDGEKISQAEFTKKGEEMRKRFSNGGMRFRN
ncbi:MAG: GLPGLI family protein [Bacteroidetes bacterium]|nr:GLPGLI family protein [Bacteroidota bacterium]MBS1540282.1 GLPGLI family protein [Bacteroidota bacterium]